MTKLHITAFDQFGAEISGIMVPGNTPVVLEPGTDMTPVDYSGGETKSAVLPNTATIVRLVATSNAHFEFGSDSFAATADSQPIMADIPEWRSVRTFSGLQISIIPSP